MDGSGIRRLAVAAAVGASLVASGCGGDDDSGDRGATRAIPAPTTSAPQRDGTLSVAAYRARLRRDCAEAERQAQRLGDPNSLSTTALARYFDRAVAISEDDLRRARSIEPPAVFADEHRASLRLSEQALAITTDLSERLRNGDAPERVLRELTPKLLDAVRRGNELADAVGVPSCRIDPLTGAVGGAPS